MSELDLIKTCADSMGLEYWVGTFDIVYLGKESDTYYFENGEKVLTGPYYYYNPLKNETQFMALFKKYAIEAGPAFRDFQDALLTGKEFDFERAVCECVAGVYQSK